MLKTQQATPYIASTGEMFVSLSTYLAHDGDLLFSSDGEMFYALGVRSVGGVLGPEGMDARFAFTNHQDGTTNTIRLTNDTIEHQGVVYTKQASSIDMPTVVPLPFARITEYLCQFGNGDLLYVSRNVYNWHYGDMKLFVGIGETMQEYKILNVDRLRDGGTTHIKMPDNYFSWPQQMFPTSIPKFPSWSEGNVTDNLTILNPADFDIVETPEGKVAIAKR